MTKSRNIRLAPLMPKLEQAIHFSGESGLELDAMRRLFPGYAPHQVNKSANELAAQGRAYKSGKGTNCSSGIKWFARQEWASAWAEMVAGTQVGVRGNGFKKPRRPSMKQIGHAQTVEALRRAQDREADFRASNRSGYELTEEDKAKVTDAGGFSGRHRYSVDPAEITGGFGALKPGQYAFEPTSCAARAFA